MRSGGRGVTRRPGSLEGEGDRPVNVARQSGQFVLPGDLPVGKELTAADLLKLGVPAKTGCLSKLS